MQITIKSTRIIKEGERDNNRGHYIWVSVMAEDGSQKGKEYTTFADGMLAFGPGSVIDIGDVDSKEEEYQGSMVTKLSFKKIVSVISQSAAPAPAPGSAPSPNGGPARETSPEEWKEKQSIERASFEGQTAFKGIIELVGHYLQAAGGVPEELREPLDLAVGWAKKRLNPTLTEAPASMPVSDKPEPEKAGNFKNIGELFAACQKIGVDRKEAHRIMRKKEGDDWADVNLNDAWETIKNEGKTPDKW